MKSVTFDSTTKPSDEIVTRAKIDGWHIAFVTVSAREAVGTDFEVALLQEDLISELGVWDEPSWDEASWADEEDANRLDRILAVISNNGFPKSRDSMAKGHLHQLRDAMILEAHARAQRNVFVTADERAFVKHGKREQLEALLGTRIVTPIEFFRELEQNHV